MPNWKLKTAVQRVISWLPKSYYWNGLLQNYVTKGYFVSDRVVEGKLKRAQSSYSFIESFRRTRKNGSKPLSWVQAIGQLSRSASTYGGR